MTQAPQPPPLPPASTECLTSFESARPGVDPQQYASKMFRSADGKIRVDSGQRSVITDLASKQTIVLDHIAKEARIYPLPQMPQMPQAPQTIPGLPPLVQPQNPASVQDLGKRFIDGYEVEGKKYVVQPPGLPGMAQAPAMPQMPGAPGMPQIPNAPPMPNVTTTEVWTSTKLQVPLITTTTGPFGQQISRCKVVGATEPPPTMFQIPQDYKAIMAPPPPNPPRPRF